jgi:hypothetical protein
MSPRTHPLAALVLYKLPIGFNGLRHAQAASMRLGRAFSGLGR